MIIRTVYEGEYLGYVYFIKRVVKETPRTYTNPFFLSSNESYLNGYVEVPVGHPYYGVSYNDIAADCHGGLTYSANEDGKWIVGYDCDHHGDDINVQNLIYNINECKRLIEFLKDKEKNS